MHFSSDIEFSVVYSLAKQFWSFRGSSSIAKKNRIKRLAKCCQCCQEVPVVEALASGSGLTTADPQPGGVGGAEVHRQLGGQQRAAS